MKEGSSFWTGNQYHVFQVDYALWVYQERQETPTLKGRFLPYIEKLVNEDIFIYSKSKIKMFVMYALF